MLISAKEEPDVSIPPAMDGLLKVHQRVIDADKDSPHAPPGGSASISTMLLVAGAQGGTLIGKQGATIKTIQDASNCKIRVVGGDIRENFCFHFCLWLILVSSTEFDKNFCFHFRFLVDSSIIH